DYIEYFRVKKGFARFIICLKEKYESLGKFTGTIKLSNITKEEKIDLEKFFGETFEEGTTIKIPLSKFDKVISRSRFTDFDYCTLVTSYLGIKKLHTKKDVIKAKKKSYLSFLEDTLQCFENHDLALFLSEILTNQNAISRIIKRKYHGDSNALSDLLKKIDILISNIPKYPTSLPLYASLTGNPHFLDFNTSTSNLFFHILSGLKHELMPITNHDKQTMLESINVYNDTLSNFVITYNLKNDQELESFSKYGPINLNIDNINHLHNVTGINNQIFIFENPSILNYFKTRDISIIITSGIPNLAFYSLLERIDKNVMLYYNGDFDPEGLLIASKIKELFPNVELFCYSIEDYNATKASECFNDGRLKKLEHLNSSNLETIKNLLEQNKKAGYQENNIRRIEKYISKITKKY
ncbi:MAG: DUF2399 domain-containing protein, partial [Bacilli bacterium]|nr:DUF2399 domain-containing protein [Bacilli bacterium]